MLTPSVPMDESAPPCEAVRGLDVRWVYHGSVGRFQDLVRVTAQLTTCPSGERLWGDTYSRSAADLVAAQEEIVTAILATSHGQKWLDHSASTWQEYYGRRTAADNARGVELARQALKSNPDEDEFRVAVLALDLQAVLEGWADSPSRRIEEMVEVAADYLERAPRERDSHAWTGYTYMLSGDRDRMVRSFERSVEIGADTTPAARAWLAHALTIAGRPDEAIASIDAAVRVSPKDAERWIWEVYRAGAHLIAGRYPDAVDAARLALSDDTNDPGNHRAFAYQYLAASLAHLGDLEAARAALEEAVRLRPALTLSVAAAPWAAADPEHRDRYLEGLRLAGLGEDGLVERPTATPDARVPAD